MTEEIAGFVTVYKTTRWPIPEDINRLGHLSESLKSFGKGHSISIRDKEFLDQLSDSSLLKASPWWNELGYEHAEWITQRSSLKKLIQNNPIYLNVAVHAGTSLITPLLTQEANWYRTTPYI
jgi:hypothetical protein